jgi:hypothetical protein
MIEVLVNRIEVELKYIYFYNIKNPITELELVVEENGRRDTIGNQQRLQLHSKKLIESRHIDTVRHSNKTRART